MSNAPDFAISAVEIARQLEAQAVVTARSWADPQREKFYEDFVLPMLNGLTDYVHGGDSIQGLGINKLIELIEAKLQEISSLAEISVDAAACGPMSAPVNIPTNLVADSYDYGHDSPGSLSLGGERRRAIDDAYAKDSPGALSPRAIDDISRLRSQN